MTLYSEAPEPLSWDAVKPTLLVCWWATLFCTVIILLRVAGRFIRSEKLFTEDKMAFLAIFPLYARMGCVHVILIYGTNNNDFTARTLTAEQLHKREIGSGLVLASRIFYAATLWTLKNTILEFFKRLTGLTWARSYQITLVVIRFILVATFVAIIISDLAECQPFSHYWQVLPDPGGQCRQGYASLLTTGICNIITDILLIVFPVPIIITSQMALKRKIQLVLLFSLSLSVVGATLYRIPHVIEAHGSQQMRSLLASVELLFATAVANALVLGSFVRDRGVKKKKFKYGSVAESAERPESGLDSRSRRPTVSRAWGSDEDLVRDVGFGFKRDTRGLHDASLTRVFTPAGPVAPHRQERRNLHDWEFPGRRGSAGAGSQAWLLSTDNLSTAPSSSGPRKLSFFDVGGLLEDDDRSTIRRESVLSSNDPSSPHSAPPSSFPASASGFRRGSQALLQDIGGPVSPHKSKESPSVSPGASGGGTELQTMARHPTYEYVPYDTPGRLDPKFSDVGGLLDGKK